MGMDLNNLLPQWKVLPASRDTEQRYRLEHTDAFGRTRQARLWVFPFRSSQKAQAEALCRQLELVSGLAGCANILPHEDHWVLRRGDGWDVCVKSRTLPTLREHMNAQLSGQPELIRLSANPALARQQMASFWDRIRLSDDRLRQLALGLCAALIRCREAGLENCTVSQDTVYLSPNGEFLLGDLGFHESRESAANALGQLLCSLLGAAGSTQSPLCGDPRLKYTARYACRKDATLEQLQQMLLHPERVTVPKEPQLFENAALDPAARIRRNASLTMPISMNQDHLVCLRQDGSTLALSSRNHSFVQVSGWKDVQSVATGITHTLGLLKNGRVVAVGSNGNRQCSVTTWQGIIQICASDYASVGLRADGRVVTTRSSHGAYLNWEGNWRDIQAVAAGNAFVAGLRKDGTVCISEEQNKELIGKACASWKDIAAIAANKRSLAGLTKDGTILTAGNTVTYNSADWTDLVAISIGDTHMAGLKADGTVIAAGSNQLGQCNVSGWKNIAAISAGPRNTLALCTDGSLKITGWQEFRQENLQSFTDIRLPEPVALPPSYRPDPQRVSPEELEARIRSRLGMTSTAAVSSGDDQVFVLEDGTAGVAYQNSIFTYAYCWTNLQSAAAGDSHTVGLLTNGTVVCAGNNESGQADVNGWTDIIQIAAGSSHTVGLCKDGTVVATGKNSAGQCAVNTWQNITAIAAGRDFTMGLKADGTVVVAGENAMWQYNTQKWSGIAAIAAGTAYKVGLKFNGTLVTEGLEPADAEAVSQWSDILSVAVGNSHIAALKANGTVVAAGSNYFGQCDVFEWENVCAIFAGGQNTLALHSSGSLSIAGSCRDRQAEISEQFRVRQPQKPILKAFSPESPSSPSAKRDVAGLISLYPNHPVLLIQKNGTISSLHNGTLTPDLHKWKSVKAVSQGQDHIVGLQANGRVVAIGRDNYGQCDVKAWRDIVQICTGDRHTVGLREDGTVLATGAVSNRQCDVSGWKNITAIAATGSCTAGLCADGSVVRTDYPNQKFQAPNNRRITAITFAGEDLVCLLSDSRLHLFADRLFDRQLLPDWMGLVAIAGGQEHLIGLTNSGRVLAFGSNSHGQCYVKKWTNVDAIFAGGSTTAALTKDGNLLLAGEDCPNATAGSWQSILHQLNIGLPDATAEQVRRKSFFDYFK